MDQPVILCGLGKVGWRVLDYLRVAGITVVAVDSRCRPDDPRLGSVRLVHGDYRQPEVLRQAGIEHARGVLILSSDDLVNISAVLMVRHLNPNVRVVVRLFNQNLILRLGKAVANVTPLSTSRLTAPLIALTALTGHALGAFGPEEQRWQVAEIVVSERSDVRDQLVRETAERHGASVVAHLSKDNGDRFLLDVEDTARAAPGDRIIACGTPEQLAPLLSPEEDAEPALRWAGWLRRFGRMSWRTISEVDPGVKICATILFAVIVVSTILYHHWDQSQPWSKSLYRTVSVIATGADMREEENTRGVQQIFVSILRLLGVALVASFTAFFTNYLLRARLGGVLEIRRIPDSGHIVVCGLGNVGFRVVEELLHHEEQVVVIELSRDSRFLATARRAGVAVIVGDATVEQVLRQAHAATARAVIAATDNELANLEIALLARELNPRQRVVVRLADPALAQTLRETANIRFAVSIPALAAPAFAAAAFGDRVQSVFMVGTRLLAAVELVVDRDDPRSLEGQSVRALAAGYRLLPVCLASENGSSRQPILEQTLGYGDRLTFIAALPDLERLLRHEPPPAP